MKTKPTTTTCPAPTKPSLAQKSSDAIALYLTVTAMRNAAFLNFTSALYSQVSAIIAYNAANDAFEDSKDAFTIRDEAYHEAAGCAHFQSISSKGSADVALKAAMATYYKLIKTQHKAALNAHAARNALNKSLKKGAK